MIQQGLEIKLLHPELNVLTIRPPISSRTHPSLPSLLLLSSWQGLACLVTSKAIEEDYEETRLLEETDAQTLVSGNDDIRLPISHKHIQYSPWREDGQVTLWKIL